MDSPKPRSRNLHISDACQILDESTLRGSGFYLKDTFYIPTLTFLSGESLGKEIPLLQPRTILGRGMDCDVVVLDPSVSRSHALITCRKQREEDGTESFEVDLQDLNSRNGSYVNYSKVESARLSEGDKVILGRVVLKFEFKDLVDQSFSEQFYQRATMDDLTSLQNRSSIMRLLSDELGKARRYHRSLSLLLLDLDDFKTLNDTHGHPAGDEALRLVGRVLARNLRSQDHAGRFGGEEFLVVLPETGTEGAQTVAERIRCDLEQSGPEEMQPPLKVTASIGISGFPEGSESGEELLKHADIALYQAKELGKNRSILWRPPVPAVG